MSVDLRVVVMSPDGDSVVPLEVDVDLFVTAPSVPTVRWVLVSTVDVVDGMGDVDCVVVVLDDVVSARLAPVIIARTIAAASIDLIMPSAPLDLAQARIACCTGRNMQSAAECRQTRNLLRAFSDHFGPAPARAPSRPPIGYTGMGGRERVRA